MLLREFLERKQISKRALTDIKFNGGLIAVNGSEETVRYKLHAGDRIHVTFPYEKPACGLIGEQIPLAVLYEDDYLLVIEKPAGMNTIPSREHPSGSLANGLIGYYEQKGIRATTHIVTRLDRDTSGLVLVAKHRHVHHLLSEMQKQHHISRTYQALAMGIFTEQTGLIEQPIGRKESSIIEREVREDGQYASTRFQVIDQYPEFAQVKLNLQTGRTHQIRVHLSYLGHPLLGDDLYGGSKNLLSRQALHCGELAFSHPMTGENLRFTQPLPQDMQDIIDQQK
ncbi:RluA family pseudouridine synthase [Bacillus ectoiniformans]|uniref:RluA family pseudouridine synthase n=1 Tax=Bacillus ectoiniformans TaxID=1494429 RepID=UPI00195A219A|nr:RluA family pseudouridine synthase [Bacillus ectoiniformans]